MALLHYTHLPVDRAHHLRRDERALAELLDSPDKLVLPIWREMSLVTEDSIALLAHGIAAAELVGRADNVALLGLLPAGPVFAADLSHMAVEGDAAGPDLGLNGRWMGLRAAAPLLPEGDATLLGYARALMIWHRRQRFCGSCGAPTEIREGGHMRQCADPHCAAQHYPRTDPAVIMRVESPEGLLLHRQPSWAPGMWSILAGFVEPAETLEQAVAREVLEETGIEVADIAYFGSQPWPYPGSIMLGFSARAVGGILAPDPHELDDARWFSRQDLLANFSESHRAEGSGLFLPTPGSISRRMIDAWLAGE